MNLDQLQDLFVRAQAGPIPLATLPAAAGLTQQELSALGFSVDAGQVRLPMGLDLLRAETIRAHLVAGADTWLRDVHIFPFIGSTNTWLMAREGNVDGQVALAECQVSGRGRRGRSWFSPIAANVAVSIGMELQRPMSELGGLSLVVGLAALDALDPAGDIGLALKWPNDLQLGERKLSGILVELAPAPTGSQVVIGIGVNWRLNAQVSDQIGRAAVDMTELMPDLDRNRGAARLISSIYEFVRDFDEHGLEPLVPVYDKYHAYTGRDCVISSPHGELQGRVLGVTASGELRLQTAVREERVFAGEVSLRSVS